MKKKALKIQDLKVSSFVTSLDEKLSQTIVGASVEDIAADDESQDELGLAAGYPATGWYCRSRLQVTGCIRHINSTRTSVLA